MVKVTAASLLEMKKRGEKITALTAYDAPTARFLNDAGVDVVLVGDSVGNVKLGYENTLPVTLEEMLHHTKAAARGNSRALLAADMPYLTYQISLDEARRNAGRLVKEGGAAAVKLEGGIEVAGIVKALVDLNIPVMGHLGLTPQAIHRLGGYKMQGKTEEAREKMITDAKVLEGAGIFALVLECVPPDLAKAITKKLSVPTIGIGAGPDTDGQILVTDDLLGLTQGPVPKFVQPYADLKAEISRSLKNFNKDVKEGRYPERSSTAVPGEPIPQRES
ncbi:MAG: 3-methyl-2-oxobutanoate hydroxymethyltransferase [Elusimicrobia bacterium RIFCSPLOWO2_01_FULL_60_11]|nr:MAG: 3-methyl-2-oxobutanoate hydroxymethyltransferase [Elusimicrobia bacterium RIFCSPLOWO2_01_FULL_60_11]